MLLNIIHVIILASTFLYMFNTAQFAQTRLVALVPLGMLLVDICSMRADFLSVPALAVLLAAARITVLLCCVGAMRADRRMARARKRANLRRRMVMRTAAIANVNYTQSHVQYA